MSAAVQADPPSVVVSGAPSKFCTSEVQQALRIFKVNEPAAPAAPCTSSLDDVRQHIVHETLP